MSIAYLLVLIALLAFGGAVWALFWAIDAGQYDDLEKHGSTALEAENVDSLHFRANGDGPD